jgi:hypothetical protein
MQKLGLAFLVLATGLVSGLVLVTSASGTTATSTATFRQLQLPMGALAIDGDRVAYDLNSRDAKKPHTTKVLVWNVRTGRTVKVSGKKTAHADDTGTGAGAFQLAIAGSRVAWLINEGGNLESQDYLLTSSVSHPKERQIATAFRSGDGCLGRETCAGPWLGGLVGSGNVIALNRWTTDSQGNVTSAGLDVLNGTKLKAIATGTPTVRAVSSDEGREAVLHSDESVAVYSHSGDVLMTLPPASAQEAALGGNNLVVVTKTRQLQVYDVRSGSLKKTLSTQGRGLHNLDVQGNIAIYTTGKSVRAANLSSGKTRAVGTLGNRIAFARISNAGLAYAANGTRKAFGTSTLVFVRLARVKAAVS